MVGWVGEATRRRHRRGWVGRDLAALVVRLVDLAGLGVGAVGSRDDRMVDSEAEVSGEEEGAVDLAAEEEVVDLEADEAVSGTNLMALAAHQTAHLPDREEVADQAEEAMAVGVEAVVVDDSAIAIAVSVVDPEEAAVIKTETVMVGEVEEAMAATTRENAGLMETVAATTTAASGATDEKGGYRVCHFTDVQLAEVSALHRTFFTFSCHKAGKCITAGEYVRMAGWAQSRYLPRTRRAHSQQDHCTAHRA